MSLDANAFTDTSLNSTSPKNVSTVYLNYSDKDLGFNIQYPSDWTIDNQNSQFSTVVGFKSPDNDASVDIRIFPKGDYKSLKDYGDKSFREGKDITLLNYYRNSSTLLSGKPAVKAIYLTTYNPSLFENAFGYKSSTSKAMMISTMVPDKKSIYAIAYFANGDDFNDFRPVIEKMVDSFKIDAKGPVIQEDNSSSTGE
jgi:PsbP-like protein